jgi:hypothetical protein
LFCFWICVWNVVNVCFFFCVCFCFFRIRDHLGICLGDFEVPSMSPGSEFYISARGYIVTIWVTFKTIQNPSVYVLGVA